MNGRTTVRRTAKRRTSIPPRAGSSYKQMSANLDQASARLRRARAR